MSLTHRTRVLSRTGLALALLTAAGLVTAGPLNPPAGPVASTYKTLNEVEPRIAINLANTPGDADSLYRITQPGSYCLTGNITGVAGKSGIQIDADNVTVDLNGFEMRGIAGANSGIIDSDDETRQIRNVTIVNGSISSWPYGGVVMEWVQSGRIADVAADNNGGKGVHMRGAIRAERVHTRGHTWAGIQVDTGSTLESCTAFANNYGFYAEGASTLRGCTASYNQFGFSINGGVAQECSAHNNYTVGFEVDGAALRDCVAFANATGVLAGYRTIVENCSVDNSSVTGIRVEGPDGLIRGNRVSNCPNNSGDLYGAILATAAAARTMIDGNTVSSSTVGIRALPSTSTVIRNTSGGNGTNYTISGGVRFGTIVKATSQVGGFNVSPSTATVAGTIVTTDPFANISY